MTTTKRYEGPLKAGQKWALENGSVVTLADNDVASVPVANRLRSQCRPVRPAADDKEAWELFLPDGPLPDTGMKLLRAGQVWAFGRRARDALDRGVVLVTDYVATLLAGVPLGNRASDTTAGFSGNDRARCAVLLFDTDEPAKAVPAERQLAPGWVRLKTPGIITAAEFERAGGPRRGPSQLPWPWSCCCPGPQAAFAKGYLGACESCAEKMGVFANSPTISSPPSQSPSSRYSAPENASESNVAAFNGTEGAISKKPCRGCNDQPFDARRCQVCGRDAKEQPTVVKVRAVGKYGPVEHIGTQEGGWAAAQTGVAPGLSSERLPERKREKVRAIYLPGNWRDQEDVPNADVW